MPLMASGKSYNRNGNGDAGLNNRTESPRVTVKKASLGWNVELVSPIHRKLTHGHSWINVFLDDLTASHERDRSPVSVKSRTARESYGIRDGHGCLDGVEARRSDRADNRDPSKDDDIHGEILNGTPVGSIEFFLERLARLTLNRVGPNQR